MKNTILRTAIHTALGATVLASSSLASATVTNYSWNGLFTFLDPSGQALANTSIYAKGANQYLDYLSGTLAFDDVTGSGVATMSSFEWGQGTAPMEATSFNLQAIGDGAGGPGTLIMGNMLFNWNGTYGFPVSIVLDAAGFFGATSAMWSDGTLGQADVAGFGAVPASDGTYVSPTWGYLGTGPVPMATTEWNLTRSSSCPTGYSKCFGVAASGILPLVTDTAVNSAEYLLGDGVGTGGVPAWDGPFTGFNFNIDITEMTTTAAVPVPAAVWLFGLGLLGTIGLARRKAR